MALAVAVLGVGAVGARAVRQLASTPAVSSIRIADADARRAASVEAAIADPARLRTVDPTGSWWSGAQVAIVASPPGTHRPAAERLLEAGVHVVSTSDSLAEVQSLLALDHEARERGRRVVVGAGFGPGLSCLLAAHAGTRFDAVDEVRVARFGAGGPACVHQRRRALVGRALDWRGVWTPAAAGSGRELCWFPGPIGGVDCSGAALPDPLLLVPAFPGVARVSARIAAGPVERLTARLPPLRRPGPDGGPGAVRVEVHGRRAGATDVVVLGAFDRPGVAAGAVAALAAVHVADRGAPAGSAGMAVGFEPATMLGELAQRGIKAAEFEGRTA